MSLLRPVQMLSHGTQGHVTQAFDGRYSGGKGYIRTDLPVKRGNRRWFPKTARKDPIHLAIDYSAAIGTPVYAVHAGEVVDCGEYAYTGEWYVALRIRVGRLHQVVAFYTHLRHDSLRVRKGDKVKRGKVLALTGNSGWSTGPHLHFELRRGWRWQGVDFSTQYNAWLRLDPLPFFTGQKTLRDVAP